MIWERTRHCQRLRHALREYFPAALRVFEDLDARDTLELLTKAPDPVLAAKLDISAITDALKRARRKNVADKAPRIQAELRADHLTQPETVVAAYAATTRSTVAILAVLNAQITTMQAQVESQVHIRNRVRPGHHAGDQCEDF